MLVTTWILAAGALVDAQTYSYSYTTEEAPTTAPTATTAPTRTATYAPSRVTEAPSYAPTTDTYAPTLGACPPLGVLRPDQCPLDTTGLPPCTDVGLGLSARRSPRSAGRDWPARLLEAITFKLQRPDGCPGCFPNLGSYSRVYLKGQPWFQLCPHCV